MLPTTHNHLFPPFHLLQVAVYGKSFCRAARDTWDLFQNQGLHLLINDDLTNGVIFMGCILGGLLSASVAGVWTYVYHKEIVAGVTIISFVIGLYMVRGCVQAAVFFGPSFFFLLSSSSSPSPPSGCRVLNGMCAHGTSFLRFVQRIASSSVLVSKVFTYGCGH